MLLCVEFALEGEVSCLERPALQVIRATSDVKLAHLEDPAEALCKLGNATSHCVKVYIGWSFLRKHIKMFLSTLHTLKWQAQQKVVILFLVHHRLRQVRWSMAWIACAWQSACLRLKRRKIS